MHRRKTITNAPNEKVHYNVLFVEDGFGVKVVLLYIIVMNSIPHNWTCTNTQQWRM